MKDSAEYNYYNDLIKPFISDVSERLPEGFSINEDKVEVIKELCDAMLFLEKEMRFDKFVVEFNDGTGEIEFRITTGYFTISRDSKFYKLLEHANTLTMETKEKGETVELCFVFDGIWEYI